MCVCVLFDMGNSNYCIENHVNERDGLPFNRFDDCAVTVHRIPMNFVSLVASRIRLFQ